MMPGDEDVMSEHNADVEGDELDLGDDEDVLENE